MMNLRALLVMATIALFSGYASATPVFEDDFATYGTGVFNQGSSMGPWSVTGPANTNLEILYWPALCGGGDGYCLDMQGTGNTGGNPTLETTLNLGAADYELSFIWGNNNHLGSGDDNRLQYLMSAVNPGDIASGVINTTGIANGLFSTQTVNFTLASSQSVLLSFANIGQTDDSGPMLDYVSITALTPVPAPASLALLGLGLIGLGLRRR